MALDRGSRIGVYQIVGAIGAGGMGEVYRAHDTVLGRDVAIKLLPDAFAADADRLARFEREARVLASLNHPNIATIYGLERNGRSACLVMELAPGDTLAARIAHGALPLDEALAVALKIAAALEAAHDKGIVHRDLKPANVIVAPDGNVKVLDFGLAKGLTDEPARIDLTHSPTVVHAETMAGVLLGTAAYMSPEQARGRAVDVRADIWAFGCVLFEMLAGRRAFSGESITDIVAAVLTREPDWSGLPPIPPGLDMLLRRTLKKDPAQRIHHIADARLRIEDLTADNTPPPHSPVVGRWTGRIASATACLVVAAAVAALWQRNALRPTASDATAVRLEMASPPGIDMIALWEQSVCISPDGSAIAFVAARAGVRQLYLRRLADVAVTALSGTERTTGCFFSPDGRTLGVSMSDKELKRLSLADGQLATITLDGSSGSGAAWAPGDRIIFGRDGALWETPSAGGAERRLTTLDVAKHELLHLGPIALPSGQTTLFTVVTGNGRGDARIDAVDRNGTRHVVIENGARPMYASSGQLLFFRDGALMAAPFDVSRLTLGGPAVRVLDGIALGAAAMPIAALSQTGTLVTVPAIAHASRLVWVTRDGVERPAIESLGSYASPRLAPDGHRLVTIDPDDVWVHETGRGTQTRLGAGTMVGASYPVWTPDGGRVVLHTALGMRLVDAGGSGRTTVIPGTTGADYPTSISPDGRTLVFHHQTNTASGDIYVLPLLGADPTPRPLVVSPAYESAGLISPDGHWLAYVSDESGRFQVYVRRFPAADQKWAVSPQDGTQPQWSRDGRELFYRNGDRLMAAEMSPREDPPVSTARVLFEQRYAPGPGVSIANYDVASDGRFLMVKEVASGRLNVILNWFTDLNRLAPVR